MRRGLFWKLFVLQLIAAATLLAGALVVTRILAVRSFGDYLETRERAQVKLLAEDLARNFSERGDLATAAASVPRLRDRPPRDHGPRGVDPSAPHDRPDDPAPFGKGPPPPLHERGEGPLPPLQLQDAQGHYLRGDPHPYARDEGFRQPIEANGVVVGYLAWHRFPGHPAQAEFAARQARGFVIVGVVALALAALFAAWITALIVRPIRALSAGTAALGRREFSVRVPETRADELGQLATDFNRLAEALAGFDARQRQWLADIAHELRTPASVLRGELEAIIDGIRAASPEAMRSLHEEVGRLAKLIDDLHLLSLAESSGLRLQLEATDAGEIAAGAAARFRDRFNARGFSLDLRVADRGLGIRADSQRIEQVLANLLENALRHAASPGPVSLAAERLGSQVRLSVADAGPGVPDEALLQLFDRLFRVDPSRSRDAGGAGLGLSICRSVVEAHGGTIAARRSAAGGLVVEILLAAEGP